ncbi:hypothetical protein DAPPUDRAFT_244226 [Daphnia pulex]|uniref:Uncharacterized protein n=1 Tax=Daphnia pulex TaxID=6669 RepID=E9GKH4_DAPPU|nr:hypothetical protein DAPPUDRAFT_244226 [Daphnia pulex]|eukprot:EFX80063.1 hypothetical protein DAPPUDRAFT_244226 [Daphnia pulex]
MKIPPIPTTYSSNNLSFVRSVLDHPETTTLSEEEAGDIVVEETKSQSWWREPFL